MSSTDIDSRDVETAIALHRARRLADAIGVYAGVLQRSPDHAEALHLIGVAFHDGGDSRRGLPFVQKAVTLRPDMIDAQFNLGVILQHLGRHEEAVAVYQRVLVIRPDMATAHMNLANGLQSLNRPADSIPHYEKAIALEPNSPLVYLNLGSAMQALHRYDEAIAWNLKAISIDSKFGSAYMNLGNAYQALNRFDEAIQSYERALALQPELAMVHVNIGSLLLLVGRQDEALARFDQALAMQPDLTEALWNKCVVLLERGQFKDGWPLFESRWRSRVTPIVERTYPQRRWMGERVEGVLLIWGEQGLGDQIMHMSMIDECRPRAARIALEIEHRLVPLVARSFPGADVIAMRNDRLFSGRVDAHIGLGSLGQILRPSFEAFPRRDRGYLVADSIRAKALRERIAQPGKHIVGLSWRSANPRLWRAKTAQLGDFSDVLRIPDCRFIDLQYGDTRAEREAFTRETGLVVERLDDIDNMMDIDGLAALITACDFVVTVSNTTAHLAGALGKPTWVFSPHGHAGLWYWFMGRANSPWYARVRVRRQVIGQSWRQLVGSAADEIAAAVRAPSKAV